MKEMGYYELFPLGDSGITVKLGQEINQTTHERVKALSRFLEQSPFPGMIEYVPGFTTVTIFYDPILFYDPQNSKFPYERVVSILTPLLSQLPKGESRKSRVIKIPVCYGEELGRDLEDVATFHGLTPQEVIRLHTEPEYLVYMIGFAPGFPYLGGMNEQIATPRRDTPRLVIPAGSVGIGGKQTGVYPIESPGGWQLIGRTPLQLFQPCQDPPSLLRAGDRIRFYPISKEEYDNWEETAR
jgi:inhibitor of KinA